MALRTHPESDRRIHGPACPLSGPAAQPQHSADTTAHAQALIAAADYLNMGRQRGCPDPLFDNLLSGVIDTITTVAADLQSGGAA
jgi:hypothetical protein